MAVTEADVRHVAALARIAIADDRIPSLLAELNGILDHMEVLSSVDTERVIGVAGVGAAGMPLREDRGTPLLLHRDPNGFAPRVRDGFFLVPRLATHEGLDAAVDNAP